MGIKYDRSQLRVRKLAQEDLTKGLAEFEAKYGMDSQTFYTRYNKGEMGDAPEFIRWAFYWEAASLGKPKKTVVKS
ncbi:MAG: hypothetical protein HY680_00805 [Chloroflexi bacterium]|nr:hypothetical protein [Chloroflexota bacterium]